MPSRAAHLGGILPARAMSRVKAIPNDGLIFPTKMLLRHLTTPQWMVRTLPALKVKAPNQAD